MYTPLELQVSLSQVPGLSATLLENTCGQYCACSETDKSQCFAGSALLIESGDSGVAYVALWADFGLEIPELPAGAKKIYVIPKEGGLESRLHGWFTGAQRIGGRPFGIGPDFTNFEPQEWSDFGQQLGEIFQGSYFPVDFLSQTSLPGLVRGYISEADTLYREWQPEKVCPQCYDPTCPVANDPEAQCVNSDYL